MQFYTLLSTAYWDKYFAYGEQRGKTITGESIKCEGCGSFLTMLEWLPPHEINVSKKKVGDFIFGSFSGIMVSNRIKELYLSAGLKGITEFRPVKLFYRNKYLEDKEYYFPRIVLCDTKIDFTKSNIIYDGEGSCNICQRGKRSLNKVNGYTFKNPELIQEDIFHVKALPSKINLSERFIKFIEKFQLTNIYYIITEKFKDDLYSMERTMTPVEYEMIYKQGTNINRDTKIGDVFSLKIDCKHKKYFQYVANDTLYTEPANDVIRAFKKIYNTKENPDLNLIVKDEIEFYAHCALDVGLKHRYWNKVGNISDVGSIYDINFLNTINVDIFNNQL